MANAQKVSVSIAAEDLRWLKRRARQEKASLSAVLAEGTRLLRQREAQERLLQGFGRDAELSEAEAEEIRALWRG